MSGAALGLVGGAGRVERARHAPRVVRWGARVARLAVASLAMGAATAVTPGCAIQGREPATPTVSLRMRGQPADAVVVIDDQALGTLELVMAHGVALPPGVHHVTVKADGFFPWDREVEAKLGQGPVQLEVALTPVPD